MYELLPSDAIASQMWKPEGDRKVAIKEKKPARIMDFVFMLENHALDGLSRKSPII